MIMPPLNNISGSVRVEVYIVFFYRKNHIVIISYKPKKCITRNQKYALEKYITIPEGKSKSNH